MARKRKIIAQRRAEEERWEYDTTDTVDTLNNV